MEIICKDRVFTLKNGSDVLLHTDADTPMVYVGCGEERVRCTAATSSWKTTCWSAAPSP